MRNPPLGAFRVFDVAAQTQSFVKAADILNVTHGAVSRQIRQLEETLGVDLFERRNRAVFLTAAGHALQATTTAIFEQLEGTVHRLRQQAHDNILVLSCEPTIAMKWLIPRLPAFQKACPDIQLHLSAAGGPIDFQKSGVDLALRRDDFKWDSDIQTVVICDEWVGPVCVPANVSSLETGAQILHTKSRPAAWKHWKKAAGVTVAEAGRVQYEHFYLCIQAAVAGLGVAMSSFFMAQDEVDRRQLVAPYGFVRDGSRYCLLASQPLEENPRCQRFAQWVTQEMQACVESISQLATSLTATS